MAVASVLTAPFLVLRGLLRYGIYRMTQLHEFKDKERLYSLLVLPLLSAVSLG